MNKEIHIENPRYPYGVLFIITLLGGGLIAWSQHNDQLTSNGTIYAILISICALILAGRIFILYLKPRAEWRQWAKENGGKYSFPYNVHTPGNGLVLDMLEGKFMGNGKHYLLMRVLELSLVNSNSGLSVRRYVIVASKSAQNTEGDMFIHPDDVLYVQRYYYKIPALKDMVASASKAKLQ